MAIIVSLLMVISAGVGQFGQLIRTDIDVRSAALIQWADGDKKRLQKVDEFTKMCLIGKPVKTVDGELRPLISIEQCANSNGFEELLEVVRQARQAIKSYAWPLSLVAS